MTTRTESGINVELALRSAVIAKQVLEMMSMSPSLARMQLQSVAEQILELKSWLHGK